MQSYFFFRATAASGALAATLAPGRPFAVHEIRLHLGGAGAAENFTSTLDNGAGATYDAVLDATSTSGVTDLRIAPTAMPWIIESGDVDFACTNTNNVAWGLEVVFSHL